MIFASWLGMGVAKYCVCRVNGILSENFTYSSPEKSKVSKYYLPNNLWRLFRSNLN